MRIIPTIVALALCAIPAAAQQRPDPANADAAVKAAFPTAPADWAPRLAGDDTMQQCSATRNSPPKEIAEAIQKRELGTIVYPPDNNFMGDWKKGEALAQSGYGLRFTDYPARQANGGNCYACHQLTRKEVSYGTLGPSLFEYGKLRDFKPEAVKAAYEKVYNSHAAFPCSTMPRFGTNKVLTVEQIKDAVALLMSPESPVNTGQ
jgi:L-cysteine S-thiosulfotransferase